MNKCISKVATENIFKPTQTRMEYGFRGLLPILVQLVQLCFVQLVQLVQWFIVVVSSACHLEHGFAGSPLLDICRRPSLRRW